MPAIKQVIDAMAELPNCRAWYSCDRDTGVPADVPPRVRLAWLAVEPSDAPPPGTDLVFRVRRLRRAPSAGGAALVCPAEDGAPRAVPITCARCGYCWRGPVPNRVPLPVLEPPAPGREP